MLVLQVPGATNCIIPENGSLQRLGREDVSMGREESASQSENKADTCHFLIVGLQIQIQHLVKKMAYTAPKSLDSKPAFKSPLLSGMPVT